MPTMEEFLATETHKEDGLDVERRVFYTLIGEEGSPNRGEIHGHRNSKLSHSFVKRSSSTGCLLSNA
jgi:hypothetical protein